MEPSITERVQNCGSAVLFPRMSHHAPDRAVAVVVRDDRLLVIDRYLRQGAAIECVMCEFRAGRADGACAGHRYVVLPGGAVEPGETPAEAAERELTEETTLRGSTGRPLWTGSHNGRVAHYFE